MSSKFRIIATALIGLLLVVGTLGAMAANQRALARPLGQSGGHLVECYASGPYEHFEVYTWLIEGGFRTERYALDECSSCSYLSATIPYYEDIDFRFGCYISYPIGYDFDYGASDIDDFDYVAGGNDGVYRWRVLGEYKSSWQDGHSAWASLAVGGAPELTPTPTPTPTSTPTPTITPTPSPTPDPSSPEDWLVFPNCEFDLANANSGSCSVYPGASSIEASWLQDTDWPEVRDYTAYITQSGTISSFEVCLAGSGYSDWYGGDLAEPTVGFDGACSDYSVYQSGSCFEYIHDTSNFTGACRITSLSANEVRGNKSECSDDNCSIELWWYFSAINEQPIQAFSPEPPPWMPTATPTPVPATVTPNPTPFPTPEQPYNPGFPASGWYTDDKGAGKTRAPKIPRESPAPWFKAPKLRPPKFPKVISFPVLPDLPPPSLQPITLDVVGEGKGWNKRLAPKFDPLTLPHINDWQAPEMNPMSLPVAPVLQPLTLPTGGAYTLHKLPKLKSPKIPTTMTFSKMPKLLSDKIPTSSNFLSVPEVITLPGQSAKGYGKTIAEKYQPVITRVKTLATKTKEFGKPSTIKVRGKTAVSMSQEFSVGFMEATDYLRAVADLEVIGPSVAAVLLGLGWIFLIMVAKLHIKAISTIVDLAIRFMDFVAELVPM